MKQTPKFVTIAGWCELSSMGRTKVYAAISRGDLTAVKVDGRTLIDAEHGLAWLRSLPPAEIKPQQRIAA